MAASARETVDTVLRGYAQRGVFRALDVRAGAAGVTEYTLHWLTEVPMRLVTTKGGRTLTLKNLLPDVTARSVMHRALQAFIDERLDKSLPAHRRIDPRVIDVKWVVARRKASLVAEVKGGDAGAAARRLVNLVHELFVYLQGSWAEYLWGNFGTSTE